MLKGACCCFSKTASIFEGQSSFPVFGTTVSISPSSLCYLFLYHGYRNTHYREDWGKRKWMQGENQKRSEGNCTFLWFPTRKGIFLRSPQEYLLTSAGVQTYCPVTLPVHCFAPDHSGRCRAAQVPLAVVPSPIQGRVLAPWGLPLWHLVVTHQLSSWKHL